MKHKFNFVKLFSIGTGALLSVKLVYGNSFAKTQTLKSFYSNLIFGEKNEKLVGVIMVTRHGSRTPLYQIPGIKEAEYKTELLDSFVKSNYELRTLDNRPFEDFLSYNDQKNLNCKLKGGASKGQLTVVGEEQMFNLGRRIKQRYINELKFLSAKYNPIEIYARSSHLKRTINSAKSLLAGIYLESNLDENITNPFLINVNQLEFDVLFPNTYDCKFLKEFQNYADSHYLINDKEYDLMFNKLNKLLENKLNKKIFPFLSLLDDINARKAHNLPYPNELQYFYENSNFCITLEMKSNLEKYLDLNCGQFFNLLKDDLETFYKNDFQNREACDFQKFRFYSAHDTTLCGILLLLNLIDEKNFIWPPFASDFIIEMWKNGETLNSDYFIKVFYCGQLLKLNLKKENSKDLTTKTKLNDFIEILDKYKMDHKKYLIVCEERTLNFNFENK